MSLVAEGIQSLFPQSLFCFSFIKVKFFSAICLQIDTVLSLVAQVIAD